MLPLPPTDDAGDHADANGEDHDPGRDQDAAHWPRRSPARLAFAAGVSAALVLGAIALAVHEERAGEASPRSIMARAIPSDPLGAEFARCQALGDAGASDAGCLAAWAQNRRRFLALDRPALEPTVAPTLLPEPPLPPLPAPTPSTPEPR